MLINFFGHQGGHSFRTGHLLTFSVITVGTYSNWALIWDWALINFLGHQGGHLFKLGTY